MQFQPQRMKFDSKPGSACGSAYRCLARIAGLVALACIPTVLDGAETSAEQAWRSLPLVADGKVDPNWVHVGWGGFIVDEGVLRTEPSGKGLGLIVFKKERLGNCQIRVVFQGKERKSTIRRLVWRRLTDLI